MRIRRSTVEHPYGTIKSSMGWTHFLTKGLGRVQTEMSLHVLAYNIKRLMTLLGIAKVMDAIRAYALFVSLKQLLRAFTFLPQPKLQTKGRSAHNASWDFQTSPCR